MAKYVRPDTFRDVAMNNFRFLTEQGFTGPDVKTYRLRFNTSWLSVEVMFDDRDGRVITIVTAKVDDRNPRAGIQCLYVESGLGPAQHIRDIARSELSLTSALGSQSFALQQLLPELLKEGGQTLLLKCHGR